MGGPNYREYSLIRLDGENWAPGDYSTNKTNINYTDEFTDWEAWKEVNKAGLDVEASFEKTGNLITLITKNKGIEIHNVTKISETPETVYIALTGDQCAITNIRISKGN